MVVSMEWTLQLIQRASTQRLMYVNTYAISRQSDAQFVWRVQLGMSATRIVMRSTWALSPAFQEIVTLNGSEDLFPGQA